MPTEAKTHAPACHLRINATPRQTSDSQTVAVNTVSILALATPPQVTRRYTAAPWLPHPALLEIQTNYPRLMELRDGADRISRVAGSNANIKLHLPLLAVTDTGTGVLL
ncbi:hypothetical protein J6590_075340 [Homalodisca vitripennis]|nr:hypothetical protein J6590_075340 [Homalodisca vitripennis]